MTHEQQIKAVADAIGEALFITHGFASSQPMRETAQSAIAAMQVREMTENELVNTIAEEIYANEDREIAFSTINLCQRIASKLAKLGTIRIVEKDNG